MMVLGRKVFIALAIAALPVLAGCSSSTTSPAPTPTPFPLTRLYVANDSSSGHVQIFAPPFSGASTPAVEFQDGTSTDVDDVAFDGTGRLYVGNFGQDKVDVFAPPFTNTSTSTFSIVTGTGPEGVDLDSSGNLYVANRTSATLTIYNAPLSGASTAAVTISTGLAFPIGVKHDAAGRIFVSDNTSGVIQIYTPPFSNASTPSVTIVLPGAWGIFLDPAGNLWASNLTSIKEFVPPFSNASTASLTIANGITSPRYPALDTSGNLYVSDNIAFVRVYMAPLSAASTPAFSFGVANANGIRFGP